MTTPNLQRDEVEQWPAHLERVIAATCTLIKRIIVVRETDSTQDAAKRFGCGAGAAVIAGRQLRGRGRLGRHWNDTADQGIAMTLTLHRPQWPELYAIATAVAVAHAAEQILKSQVGIKWPNDVMVHNRKLAGILIELTSAFAHVGVGMNVNQTSWPDDLKTRAVSMAQLGHKVTRLDVLSALLPAIDRALRLPADEVAGEFIKRDALIGTVACFNWRGQRVQGTVQRIDPMRGLAVLTDSGERWLDATTTSVRAGGAISPPSVS